MDLVISNIQAGAVEIVPAISDHDMVLASFGIRIPESTTVARTVFEYVRQIGQAHAMVWQSSIRLL